MSVSRFADMACMLRFRERSLAAGLARYEAGPVGPATERPMDVAAQLDAPYPSGSSRAGTGPSPSRQRAMTSLWISAVPSQIW